MSIFGADDNQNSWLKSPKNAHHFFENEISTANFFELSANFQLEAQDLLTKSTYVEINLDTVKKYGGDTLFSTKGKHFYLVRGVRTSTSSNGAFSMYRYKHKLLVVHGDLGKPKKLILTRSVLLVSLETPILEANADYSLAE
jgi:hypothetical protein